LRSMLWRRGARLTYTSAGRSCRWVRACIEGMRQPCACILAMCGRTVCCCLVTFSLLCNCCSCAARQVAGKRRVAWHLFQAAQGCCQAPECNTTCMLGSDVALCDHSDTSPKAVCPLLCTACSVTEHCSCMLTHQIWSTNSHAAWSLLTVLVSGACVIDCS
jgi:hypothetical protein